jgi:hypothetical protein
MLRRGVLWGLALLSGALACASPTLPLPPPVAPTVETTDAAHVKLVAGCGGALPQATIVVINRRASLPGDQAVSGAIADGCGAWDANVVAQRGDLLDITQESGTDISAPVTVSVP